MNIRYPIYEGVYRILTLRNSTGNRCSVIGRVLGGFGKTMPRNRATSNPIAVMLAKVIRHVMYRPTARQPPPAKKICTFTGTTRAHRFAVLAA